MRFEELERLEKTVQLSEIIDPSSSYAIMLKELLENEERKAEARKSPFKYFYEDIIALSLDYNFQIALGNSYFDNATHDAKSCLDISVEFRKVTPSIIFSWLQNALKFIDHLVLHYIQECCKETPKVFPNQRGIESSRYLHLANKNGNISQAGYKLGELYEMRSQNEHRTKEINGKQVLIRPKTNRVRYRVVELFPEILKIFLKTYKTELPC